MATWTPVPEVKIRPWLHGVNQASHVECFQLMSTRGSLDGPWLFVLFIHDPRYPHVLTAHFAKVHAEALDGGSSPLDNASGIALTSEEVRGLIALLETQLDYVTKPQSAVGSRFDLLKEEEAAEFHLDRLSSNYVEEYYYRQTPLLGNINKSDTSTILLFSKDILYQGNGVYFQVMQFLNSELEKSNFRPRDQALPYIYLDKMGIRSLVGLFQRFLT